VNQVLTPQVDELIRPTRPSQGIGLGAEGTLRVAAELLCNSQSQEVTATTVVGVLGQDDAAAFETLVADIAEECGLETRIRLHVGSFSVRFSRQNGQ
jgi:hypothetical protein